MSPSQVYERIRHSTDIIQDLPLDYRGRVTTTYGHGVKLALTAAVVFSAISTISSYWAKGVGLQRRRNYTTSGSSQEEATADVPQQALI
jgi:hypothetical protein